MVGNGTTSAVWSLVASTPKARSASVTWVAPAVVPSAVVRYEYLVSTTGTATGTWKTNKTSTSLSLGSLRVGTAYTLFVRAVNAFGTGAVTSVQFTAR